MEAEKVVSGTLTPYMPKDKGATSKAFSSYARQFLEQLKKPEVDSITGLSPSISIEQKTTSTKSKAINRWHRPQKFMTIFGFSMLGLAMCPIGYNCGNRPISSQTIDQMISPGFYEFPDNSKLHILAPMIRGKKRRGYGAEFRKWMKQGFVRARVDGQKGR